MLFKGVIIVAAIALVVLLWVVFGQDYSDSEGLQNAIDGCTNAIDNMGPSDSDLENCLELKNMLHSLTLIHFNNF